MAAEESIKGIDINQIAGAVSKLYTMTKIIGTAMILGGTVGLVLTLSALNPVYTTKPFEFISLTVLACVYTVSGIVLFGYVNHLEYRVFIASRFIDYSAYKKFLNNKPEPPEFVKGAGG